MYITRKLVNNVWFDRHKKKEIRRKLYLVWKCIM